MRWWEVRSSWEALVIEQDRHNSRILWTLDISQRKEKWIKWAGENGKDEDDLEFIGDSLSIRNVWTFPLIPNEQFIDASEFSDDIKSRLPSKSTCKKLQAYLKNTDNISLFCVGILWMKEGEFYAGKDTEVHYNGQRNWYSPELWDYDYDYDGRYEVVYWCCFRDWELRCSSSNCEGLVKPWRL